MARAKSGCSSGCCSAAATMPCCHAATLLANVGEGESKRVPEIKLKVCVRASTARYTVPAKRKAPQYSTQLLKCIKFDILCVGRLRLPRSVYVVPTTTTTSTPAAAATTTASISPLNTHSHSHWLGVRNLCVVILFLSLGPACSQPAFPVTIATGNAHKCCQLTRFSRCCCCCCC